MERLIVEYLSGLAFGRLQRFDNMAVIPLVSADCGPVYLTMKEALSKEFVIISELNEAGSVPELKVVNRSSMPVLFLDGEELTGAKQNRVLNTTILLKENSETVIPVSCTERDRWHHISRHFADSDVVLGASMRRGKGQAVSHSLAMCGKFDSDEPALWNDIARMSQLAQVRSPTGAMKQVFESKRPELEDYLKAFNLVPGQKGILVFVNGMVKGLDAVSLDSAYKTLHPKLVRSYAMDALLERRGRPGQPYGLAINQAGIPCLVWTEGNRRLTKCRSRVPRHCPRAPEEPGMRISGTR